MTHLGEGSVTINGVEVRYKFGMLFWKLILKRYGKEFGEIGELFKENLASPVFMLDVLIDGHKSYCELNKVAVAFEESNLVELANDYLAIEDM